MNSPDDSWYGVGKAEFFAITYAAAGLATAESAVKIEGQGVAVTVSIYAGHQAATKDEKAAAKLATAGSDVKTDGIMSILSGLVTFS